MWEGQRSGEILGRWALFLAAVGHTENAPTTHFDVNRRQKQLPNIGIGFSVGAFGKAELLSFAATTSPAGALWINRAMPTYFWRLPMPNEEPDAAREAAEIEPKDHVKQDAATKRLHEEWVQEFGEHTVCDVCGTDCEAMWIDAHFPRSAISPETRELLEALEEILVLYPSNSTIKALECDDPTHPRPCPGKVPTDHQVAKWRAVLAKHRTGGES